MATITDKELGAILQSAVKKGLVSPPAKANQFIPEDMCKQQKNKKIDLLNYKGVRTYHLEVALTAGTTSISLQDQNFLTGKIILGIVALCNVPLPAAAGGKYTTAGAGYPANLTPTPTNRKTGTSNMYYDDLINCGLQLLDRDNKPLLQFQEMGYYVPSLNYGMKRDFNPPLVGVIWDQSNINFGGNYTIVSVSGGTGAPAPLTNPVAAFDIFYLDPANL